MAETADDLPGSKAAAAAPAGATLRGKIWVAFVLQLAAISVATLLSVYGAWIVLRDVLIKEALTQETAHYWRRLEVRAGSEAPDTYNMHGYLVRPGTELALPSGLGQLPPGYHSVSMDGRDNLVMVSDQPGGDGRLYLVFEQEQVDKLALWFGYVPLTIVLAIIYITSWLTWRVSRRAISPVIWLANAVRELDPKQPDFSVLEAQNLPVDADGDVQVLASALHGFASRLEEFVERERNFTRDASHELRSPITVIKVAADVLLADGELSSFGERSVQRIQRAVRDMEALIEAFLILAREGDVGLPEENFVVSEVVEGEIDRADALVQGRPVSVKLVREGDFVLHAPPKVLAVMLSNLLRNACLYTEQGTVTATVGRDFVRIDDTGVGMSEEDLANAFQPFFRGKGAGKGGHGVGLTIVRRLADRFGWPVELSSKLGVGTSATIRFPNPQPLQG